MPQDNGVGARMRLAWILGVLTAVAYFAALAGDLPLLRVASKPVPVLCMAVVVLVQRRDAYANLVGAGLVLGAVGDLSLAVDQFLAGLGAFLIAHVLYTVAYVTDSRKWRPVWAVPAYLFGVLAVGFLWGQLGDMRVAVVVYTLVICTMLWRAAARLEPRDPPAVDRVYALAGAIAFALSDVLVDVHRFGTPPEAIQYAIMVLYWGGQLGIATSAVKKETRG